MVAYKVTMKDGQSQWQSNWHSLKFYQSWIELREKSLEKVEKTIGHLWWKKKVENEQLVYTPVAYFNIDEVLKLEKTEAPNENKG